MASPHFRFFDLPLELRDHIRDYLYEDFLVRGKDFPSQQMVVRTPMSRIRFVSQQMKHEYDQRPHSSQIYTNYLPTTLLPSCALDATTFILQRTLVVTRGKKTAAMRGFSSSDKSLVTFSQQMPDLLAQLPKVLSQLPQLKTSRLVLQLGVRGDRPKQLELFKKKFHEFVDKLCVSEIRVVKWREWGCKGTQEVLLADWTTANGLRVHERTIEATR